MTVGAIAFPESRDLHLGDEAICRDPEVTPARDDSAKRNLDASRLMFPLTVVLLIGGGIVATTGTYNVLSSRISVQDQEMVSLKEKITTLEHQIALDAVRIDETRVIIAEIKGFMTATGMKEVKK